MSGPVRSGRPPMKGLYICEQMLYRDENWHYWGLCKSPKPCSTLPMSILRCFKAGKMKSYTLSACVVLFVFLEKALYFIVVFLNLNGDKTEELACSVNFGRKYSMNADQIIVLLIFLSCFK